jgi:hypothetical protein
MHRFILRPSPALIVACLALILSLGGVAWAKASGGGSRPTGKVVQGCIQPDQGGSEGRELSLAEKGGVCPEGDVPISWNVEGAKGERGPSGPRGARGPRGEKGSKGAIGAQGPVGQTGAQGPVGQTGAKGETGATGAQGDKGLRGETGETGSQGPQGEPGLQGSQGNEGERGLQGPQGERGLQGTQGIEGGPGPAGAQGPPGISGYEVVTESETATVGNGGTVNLFPPFARCASGKELLGGGTSSNGGSLLHSGPFVENGTPQNIWESGVVYHNETGSTFTITVTAVAYCGEVSS